jgi:hypothetical protein
MPSPIAFLVMPFDTKSTGRSEPGVPADVDFDALWHRVYHPVLSELGYEAVRADRDVGALIIAEMIQRLALADLVVADVSLPNANVYYEIGVRHAAKRVGCVLVAADWAKPVFDLAQIRQLRFPLADGAVGEEAANAARARLLEGLGPLIDGSSPVFEAVAGFPDAISVSRASAFREQVAQLSAFDADVRAARLAPLSERRTRALEVFERHGRKRAIQEGVVLELLRLLRDLVDWETTLDYIKSLRENVARHPLVLEQRALALAKTGDPVSAAGELQTLINQHGRTPERLGLLGGRYKELYRSATTQADRRRYLDGAIDAYEQGMLLDLNSYYAASNLARLYRARGEPGDEERAAETQLVTMRACNRAVELELADEWARPTLLGCAFARADAEEARRLLKEVRREGADTWKLRTTIADLENDVAALPDDDTRRELDGILGALRDELSASPVAG